MPEGSLKSRMEAIYGSLSREEIPWNLGAPPSRLVALVESGWVCGRDVVDLGCGAGNHARWLEGRGFAVTGIDLSLCAVDQARRLAAEKGVASRFVVADLRESSAPLRAAFDFAFDWEVLHHVFPEHREGYVRNVFDLLRSGGRYLSVSFA